MLQKGDKAPDKSITLENGDRVNLLAPPKPLVIFFFPKAFSRTCTQQMCSVRDEFSKFEEKNVIVVGISRDPAKAQTKFSNKHHFPFPVVSDQDGGLTNAFGIAMFGGLIPASLRVSYIIDEQGNITFAYKNLMGTRRHTREVLAALDEQK